VKVFITGASGFIGSNFLKTINHYKKIEHLYILIHKKNIPDIDFPHTFLTEDDLNHKQLKIHKTIHMAQDPEYRNFPAKANTIFDTNIRLTQQVLDFSYRNGVNQFIYLSSGSIYDFSHSPVSEISPLNIADYYSFSKYTSEQLIKFYEKYFRTTILRLFFPYGPNLKDKLLIKVLENIRQDNAIQVHTDGSFSFNPIHTEDINQIIYSNLESQESKILNVAGNENITFLDIVLKMAKIVGKDAIIERVPTASMTNMTADIAKLKNNFNFTKSLEIGLKDFIANN